MSERRHNVPSLVEDDGHVCETADDVMVAFGAFLNDAAGTYGYALTGVQLTRRQVQGSLDFAGPGWADTPIEMTTPPLDAAGRSETFHAWPQSVVLERLSDGGFVAQQIGHQWLLLVFHEWEDEFRPRLAEARGIPVDEVRDPVLGDLRLMRNDIVHHRGRATEHNSGRCAQLRWFQAGDVMLIDRRMVWEVMDAFGLTFPAPEEGRPYFSYRARF